MAKRLFGTDGIRGIVGEYPLEAATLEKIAHVAAIVLEKHYQQKKIVIGYDTRASSLWIAQIIADIFYRSGYHVYLLEVFPTPGVAYVCRKLNAIGCVITASHNPFTFNGIKFFSPLGIKINDTIEYEMEDMIDNYLIQSENNETIGIFEKEIMFQKKGYVLFIKALLRQSKVAVCIDCANGSTSCVAQDIFPFARFIQNAPDGQNINEKCGAVYPECLAQQLRDGEIGITFDGDGDRIILVDEQKNVRDGDFILAIIAQYFTEKKMLKNNSVVSTIMANLGFLKYMKEQNIEMILANVGDKYVHEKLDENDVVLGGEQSGHIILKDYLPTGDGMLVAALIIVILHEKQTTLFDLCSVFEKYPQVLKNIHTEQKPPLENIFPSTEITKLEEELEGRILLRYSGTEPLLRIMIEGKDKQKIEKTAEQLADIFKQKVL